MPKSNVAFWRAKFRRTIARDKRNLKLLMESGWEPLVIWQCELVPTEELEKRLELFLGPIGN